MTKTVTLGEIIEMQLGDVFEFVRNGVPIQQHDQAIGVPITRIETIADGNIDAKKFGYANISDLTKYRGYYLEQGDILMSHINSMKHLAKCALYDTEPETLIHGMNLLCLRPQKDRLNAKYALYYLRSNPFLRQIPSIANQSVNQASFSVSSLKKLIFPLPPLPEQRRIAALLDRADALRQKGRQLLAHYDKLAQSIFIDLFGDPVRNEKGWEKVKIRDLVKEVKYGTSKPAEDKGAFPYLRMNNITYEGQWNFTDLKYINLTKAEESKYLLQKGDLVFNRTNSKELVGKTAVYQGDNQMAIAGYLIRSRVNEKATPEYISAYLNSVVLKK